MTIRWNIARLAVAALGCLFLSAGAQAATEPAAKRVALVLGNAKYKHATELDNPVNDAKAIAEKLRNMGFEVVEGVNRNVDQTYELIEKFGVAATDADVATFFYAGHGIQVNGDNYILPIDAKLEGTTSLKREAIAIADVMAEMEDRAKVKIVILDACRDNPLSRSFRKATQGTRSVVSGGLAPLNASGGGDGTFIVFATQPGNVASDGAGKHSPFSQALLKHIDAPDVSFGDMLIRVTGDVFAATGQVQRPWVNSSATGVVMLNPTVAAEEEVQIAALPPEQQQAEEVRPADERAAAAEVTDKDRELQTSIYDRAVQQNTIGGYEAYLNIFPNGLYAGLAKSAIEVLKNQPAAQLTLAPAPAPLAPAAPAQVAALPQGATVPALPAPGAAGVVQPDMPAMLQSDDWRSVQRRLGWLGFDAGRADGKPGNRTYTALSAWQQANGFAPTAQLTVNQYTLLQTQTAERHAQWLAEEQARPAAAPPPRSKRQTGGNGQRRNNGNNFGNDVIRGIGQGIGIAIGSGIFR